MIEVESFFFFESVKEVAQKADYHDVFKIKIISEVKVES